MNKYIDKIKEFCIKYKRYFGAAALLVVLIVVLVQCAGPATTQEGSQGTEPAGSETNVPADSEIVELEGTLEKDADPELVSLIENYYQAYADADIEALEMLAPAMTENEKSYIAMLSTYYENFQNLECYSMKVEDEVYFVSACFDLKFYDVDTVAPGMDFFYVERDGKGNLCINSVYASYNFSFREKSFDETVYEKILAYEQMEEVTALQQAVQARYDEAVTSDEKLAAMIETTLRSAITQWRDSVMIKDTQETEETTQQDTQAAEPEETDKPADGEDTNGDEKPKNEEVEAEEEDDGTYQVKTKDVCNIRASASKDSDVIGQVSKGAKLTALGEDGDWTKIQFSGGEGYIRSDLLKKVKKK
ncbi:MAG: SH3 domain-containing protein [Lachnospiraceae bacterium]|nr:SH3 domain-containing protein [Lachnospiraceae bacterium]MDY5521829.1 SH3 domain-containing protein [Agathobacter sp.]